VLIAIIFIHTRQEVYSIAFYSKAFNATELNYNIYDKELLAIFEAFKK